MPFRSENPIIKVEPRSMHTIDTTNVENLFGLWSSEYFLPLASLFRAWPLPSGPPFALSN